MKKLILALGLCLVLVALLATPAMAGAEKLTFTTGLTSDTPITGTLGEGFTILTYGSSNFVNAHDLYLYNPSASPDLADGYYGFTLKANNAKANPQKDILYKYFADKPWPDPAWHSQINKEINGSTPFFFLKASGGIYTLVDAFSKAIFGVDAPLRIDDDYPVGTYVYMGQLKAVNNAPLMVTVTLTVTR
jgi:hypothetical protein